MAGVQPRSRLERVGDLSGLFAPLYESLLNWAKVEYDRLAQGVELGVLWVLVLPLK